MKWGLTPEPSPGERRSRSAFAWLPLRCVVSGFEGTVWVWLERVTLVEEYRVQYRLGLQDRWCWQVNYRVVESGS